MRKRFFTVMAAALAVSGMPVMAKETSTEEKISGAVEETKDQGLARNCLLCLTMPYMPYFLAAHRIPCAELLQQISLSITILTACSNGMTNTSISSVASKCCPLTLRQ